MRAVALKLIKRADRPSDCAVPGRAQALAVMDHPNIAKVFDAGATPAGGGRFS